MINLFELLLFAFAWSLFNLFLFFIMFFFIPKKLINLYFREPYFSLREIAFLSGFPYAYYRTIMFTRLLAYPSSVKKRGLEEVYKTAPLWLRKVSKYILISFWASFVLLTGILTLGYLYIELTD